MGLRFDRDDLRTKIEPSLNPVSQMRPDIESKIAGADELPVEAPDRRRFSGFAR